MRTSPLQRSLKSLLTSLAMMLCVLLPWASTQADDLDIYTNPTPPVAQAPITMLALDLNLLDVGALACTNVLLPPPTPPSLPAASDLDCLGLQELLTAGQLLEVVGTLPGNLLGGVIGITISTLPASLLNQSLATALQTPTLITPVLNTVGSLLSSNDLLGTLTGTLPVYLALSNILHGLVDTRLGIILNHSDQAAAPAPARCSFFDESNLGGERQDTPACSNGGYIFIGLIDPTRVDELLAKLLPLLTTAVSNLIASGAAPGSLVDKAPYQTKELYAEFMDYLTGGPSYNGKLDEYDNVLAMALPRDQTADVETSNHRSYVSALDRYPQACNINLLHVQLTAAAEQDDSDTELRRLLPDVQRESDGSLSLAAVVNSAATDGFAYGSDRRRIKSYFLVQEAIGNLGDLSAVANLGSNVTTYSNVLGLVGRGRDIAGAMLKPLSIDTSLSSLTVAASRTAASGISDSAYVPAFRADIDQKPDWHGNLKRLKLQKVAGTNPKSLLEAVDARGAVAIGSSGRINANALTLWTDATKLGVGILNDGPVADLGGAGQKIPGFKLGGGGNPGRSNPSAPSTTVRSLFYDSYTSTAQLAALNPDVSAVRDELATATSASGFSSGNSACSASCNTQSTSCLAQCSTTQGSCSTGCDTSQNSCNSSCGVDQSNCSFSCSTNLNSCLSQADTRETNCNSLAASTRAQCNNNAATAQALCVAPAGLVQTSCNATADTNRTLCNSAALTAKTSRDLLCLGNSTCLANSTTTYNAAIASCTASYNSSITTCTNNYNNSIAPCTATYNDSITQCTNSFNSDSAQCTATHNSEVNSCNANNDACNSGCSSTGSNCGLICTTDAASCNNICTGNNSTCANSCSAQLGSCQAACGVDTTRTPDTEVKELLLYARGFDVGTLASPKGTGSTAETKTDSGIFSRPWMMGAVLHSKPVAINYGKRDGSSTDDVRVVFGSADGYMRMVRDDTGVESWGFMPQAVMPNLKLLRENVAGTALPYGVDGSPIVLIRDRAPTTGPMSARVTGIIGDSDDDRVLLFFGLRRGGSAYYALDITDPDSPELAWKLSPDGLFRAGQSTADAGTATQFAALGLAFSTPQVGRIQLAVDSNGDAISPAESRSVLIFGGGYNGGRVAGAKVGKDLNNSRNSVASAQVGRDDGSGTSDRGNALFMIDAASGQLIWRAVRSQTASAGYTASAGTRSYAHPMLVDSIPSDLTALDTDNDGFTDRLYVGDTGGRVWRADFPGALPSAWTITPIASIGRHNAGNSTLANDRRIFFAPDFVPIRNANNTQATDLILFGTGDREDPLNLVSENAFYALRDPDVISGKAASEIVLTEDSANLAKQSSFVDVTALSGSSLTDITKLTQAGYRVRYARTGEKHFSAPVTLGNNTTFTSYVPPDASAAGGRVCSPTEGTSRLYSLAARNSRARGINNSTQSARDIPLADGLPGEVNALAGTQQSAGALIYAIPTTDTYRASWRERLGETQK